MAQECGFFNAQLVGEEYDRVYLAEQFAAYFASFIGNGIFGKSMQKLEVLAQASPNMSIKVLSGEAWINGWWYRNTEEYTLSLDVADGVLNRIDAIVLRWGNQERDMWLQVIKGTASSSPVAPAIRRDADYYDLQLATVSIVKGAIKITQSAINDTRLVTAKCGLVTGVVDQIDTTGLYNQFEQYFAEFKATYEKDYADWTAAQKAAYLAYISNQQKLYEDWVHQKQTDYDTWTADKMAEYITWTAASRKSYEDWIAAQEDEFIKWMLSNKNLYDTWTAEQRANYEAWVAASEKDYDDWTDAQKEEYLKWIAKQQLDFRTWYDSHTKTWTKEFEDWFASIKDKFSSDIAGALQLQIDDQQKLIDNLYDMLYDGWLRSPVMGTDGYYIKASDGSYLMGIQPTTKTLQAQIKVNSVAIGNILDMLVSKQLLVPAVSSNSGEYIRGTDGSYLMFTEPLCKCENEN